jgi:hypothetical protein
MKKILVAVLLLPGCSFFQGTTTSVTYVGGAADGGSELMVCHQPVDAGMVCFDFVEFMNAAQQQSGHQL